jgi:hypothetical protein
MSDQTTPAPGGWHGEPGVPLNPEKDGWHWLQAKYYDDPVGPFMAFFWDAAQQTWPKIQPYGGRTFHYLGPCLTPDEATALQARVAELEWLAAYLCGRNTDHIQVALVGNPIVADAVIKRAEAALKGKKDE